jgi:hypothetical protein
MLTEILTEILVLPIQQHMLHFAFGKIQPNPQTQPEPVKFIQPLIQPIIFFGSD